MPQRLPDTVRWLVVERWLMGQSRNTIASDTHISTGAVSGIVDEWSHAAGPDQAAQLRGLAVTLRKLAMSPAQCASGLRVINLIEKMGLDVNSIDMFLSDIYTRLRELDVTPKYIERYVEGLLSLEDDIKVDHEGTRAISIHKIDEIFEKKRQINVKLEDEFKLLQTQLDDINQQVNQNDNKLQRLLAQNRVLEQEIEWRSELRHELQKSGLPIENISRLVEYAQFFSNNGYSLNEMLDTFSSYKGMTHANFNIRTQTEHLRNKSLEIQQQNVAQENLLEQRRLKNKELESLKSMGFGLQELKTLCNIIVELGEENGQSKGNGEIVKQFISDIENHHYDYLRLRHKIDELEKQKLIITALNHSTSILGEASRRFLCKKGITLDDVKNVITIMDLYSPGCISSSDLESRLRPNEGKEHDTIKKSPSSSSLEPRDQQASQVTDNGRKVQRSVDSKTIINPKLVSSNLLYADNNKVSMKKRKPRFPRPLRMSKRSIPIATSLNTETSDYREGQAEVTSVQDINDPEIIVPQYSKPTVDTDSVVVDDRLSGIEQNSHTARLDKGENIEQASEMQFSSVPKRRGDNSKLDLTELMRQAMGI